MLEADNNVDLLAFIQTMLAGYLLVFGLIGLLNGQNGKTRHFYFSCLSLAAFLLSDVFQLSQSIGEFSSFLLWSFLATFLSDQHGKRSFIFERFHGFIIPFIWLLLSVFSFKQHLPFQAVYFFQVILVALIGIRQTNTLKQSSLHTDSRTKHYLNWMHFGLVILIGIRLIIPLIVSDIYIYILEFHLAVCIYLIGISRFNSRSFQELSPNSFALRIEETTNQEELTKRKLELALKKEKAFLVPDLTIQELASKMHMRASDLSGFFNAKLGMNFNDVINEYRVDEVKRLIVDPATDPKATIMELAYRSGFNSKATFNRIFKQRTGSTPKEFRKASLGD